VHGTAEVGLFLITSESSIGSGVRRIEAITGEAAVRRTLDRDKVLRELASRLRVPVDQLPERVEALTARKPRQAVLVADPGAVRTDPSGQRYLVAEEPDLDVPDLPREARRLAGELSAVVVLLLPGPGSLRVGVAVPVALTTRVTATEVLDRVLAVTGGHGGGSATFAQGGGAEAGDVPGVISRIGTALGLSDEQS
jgi:alanyl-tRNA synthetase